MKRKALFIILLLAIALLATNQETFGLGKTTADGTIFDPYLQPKAKGVSFTGTVVIYYEQACDPSMGKQCDRENFCADGDFPVNMYFALRLTDGKFYYPFSGTSAYPVCYLYDPDSQINTILDFMSNTVVPFLYPSGANFAVRSVKDGVDTARPPYFVILDLDMVFQPF